MPLLIIRPDDWNFPLLLHVAGAMVMCGALAVASAAAGAGGAQRRETTACRSPASASGSC